MNVGVADAVTSSKSLASELAASRARGFVGTARAAAASAATVARFAEVEEATVAGVEVTLSRASAEGPTEVAAWHAAVEAGECCMQLNAATHEQAEASSATYTRRGL